MISFLGWIDKQPLSATSPSSFSGNLAVLWPLDATADLYH